MNRLECEALIDDHKFSIEQIGKLRAEFRKQAAELLRDLISTNNSESRKICGVLANKLGEKLETTVKSGTIKDVTHFKREVEFYRKVPHVS
jgi:hypothetical protein